MFNITLDFVALYTASTRQLGEVSSETITWASNGELKF